MIMSDRRPKRSLEKGANTDPPDALCGVKKIFKGLQSWKNVSEHQLVAGGEVTEPVNEEHQADARWVQRHALAWSLAVHGAHGRLSA